MILTLPVLIYQLFFILIMFVASRFGSKAMLVTLIVCLAWTATHVFFVPLAVLQTVVIAGSYLAFRPKRKVFPG